MRPLKILLAALVGIAVVALLATGFVVVAAIGIVAVLFLWIRKLITGKSGVSFQASFQRGGTPPRPRPRPAGFRPDDAIDIESSKVKEAPKSLPQ